MQNIILAIFLLCTLSGCSAPDVPSAFESNVLPVLPNASGANTQASDEMPLPDWDEINNEGNVVAPYQFLYLLCGNTEELSFTYTIARSDSDPEETRSFQRRGDTAVECFTSTDMNGNPVPVRELESGGKVHYIMDDSRMIKTYLAPAEDFLLYQMIEAAKTAPDRAVEQDGNMLFEHSLPFEQDETMACRYSFYMKDGVLKKLTVTLGDGKPINYEFSDFRQEITDADAFESPQGYCEESFDYSYAGEHMPPWWDIGNDE